jgi:putative hemolysin
MKKIKDSDLAFTFASSEVNKLSQNFIKIIELLTGKLTLKKLYDQYLIENNPPANFWKDAIKKLELRLITHDHSKEGIPQSGRLIVVANHAFGVVDGVSICALITDVRQDYKMITHKVLRHADAVKEKIIPIDFTNTKEAMINNIKARRSAEDVLKDNGVIVIFPSGTIATKPSLWRDVKATDGDWKQFTSKLAIRTNSPILPIFFEGQNSHLFHLANKLGLTFRYSLMMYELRRKIGDKINIHLGNIISNKKIKEIGDLKDITKYIRKKTYELDPIKFFN